MFLKGRKLINVVFFVCFALSSFDVLAENVPDLPADTSFQRTLDDKDDAFFLELFKNYPGKFDSLVLHRIGWNVQIIYTQIDRGNNGLAVLKDQYFNKKDGRYFYPTTTAGLPVAILALQKLNELKQPMVNMNTTMLTEAEYSGQTAQYNDPNTPDGRPTIAQYIKELLLVNDENAYNRLYEFLGQEYINKELKARGYASAQILSRLGMVLNEDENRHTNPVNFFANGRTVLYKQPLRNNETKYEKRSDFIGRSYYQDNVLINAPMDFSQKNRISLEDLHTIMQSLIFPDKVKPSQRFNITEDDRKFLLKYLSQFPTESVYPSYGDDYYDAFSKYILNGDGTDAMPASVRIFNKSGMDYGHITDVAYVVDFEKKIEFMVSATIYCNRSEIMNDAKQYEYATIGLPFMKDLGKALYDYELKRKRNKVPDLSSMVFSYDK